MMAVETDRKMDSLEGKSGFKTKYKNIRVNDEVEFKWLDVP